jgi:hypothetical protein
MENFPFRLWRVGGRRSLPRTNKKNSNQSFMKGLKMDLTSWNSDCWMTKILSRKIKLDLGMSLNFERARSLWQQHLSYVAPISATLLNILTKIELCYVHTTSSRKVVIDFGTFDVLPWKSYQNAYSTVCLVVNVFQITENLYLSL